MGINQAEFVEKNDASGVEKNPLIALYRDLEKSEVRRLGKWLLSPIHNQRDDVRDLHDYLTEKDHLFKTDKLSKKRIWKRLFSGQPFDDARLRQTLHWALRSMEEFLAYENWSRSTTNQQISFVVELRQRNLDVLLAKRLKKAAAGQERNVFRNERFYRDRYLIEQERYVYESYHNPLKKPNFQEIADTLDIGYLIEKLKVGCNMLFHQRIYRTEYDVRYLREAYEYAQQLELEDHPALAIYVYVYRGLTEADEDGTNISLLRDMVKFHGDVLDKRDLNYVFIMAINLCVSNMNRGLSTYVREAFEWYRLGFSRDVISDDNKLNRDNYLNVISLALKLDEHEWVKAFIDDFTHQLDEDIRDNTERFARARLGYQLKDYDDAMSLLVQVDFKHPVYNLLAKTMLLKIYYELMEYDALDSLLDTTSVYIRRKKLSDLHRDNFSNIVHYVRQLSRLSPGDRKKREALHAQIEAEQRLSEKGWLLEQLHSE